jgi:hypothetical protein
MADCNRGFGQRSGGRGIRVRERGRGGKGRLPYSGSGRERRSTCTLLGMRLRTLRFFVLMPAFLCGLAARGAEDAKVTTSVRVFVEEGRLYAEVQVANDGKDGIEVHKSPSSLDFFDLTYHPIHFDPRTGEGEGHFRSFGLMFREDRAMVVLRPGERFTKRIDLSKRIKLEPARYRVSAYWNLDKGVPVARQAELEISRGYPVTEVTRALRAR